MGGDEPRAEAQRALDEAVAVVDEPRTELDGHAAAVTALPPPAGIARALPRRRRDPRHWPGSLRLRRARSGPGRSPRRERRVHGAGRSRLSAPPLPDPGQLGDGIAIKPPDGITATAPNPMAACAVRHALTQLGCPYVWGGTTPGVGLDCSGLRQWAYHETGPELSVAGRGAGPRGCRRIGVHCGRATCGMGRSRRDDCRQRHDDPSRRPLELSPIRTTKPGRGFPGLLAAPPPEWRPPLRHCLGPLHTPLDPSDVAIVR